MEPKAAQLSRVEKGDLVAVDILDMDRATAEALVRRKPSAVLNASTTISGRYPTKGASVLVAAGIPLIDQLGPDLVAVRDGQHIELEGAQVRRRGRIIAEGVVQTEQSVQEALSRAQDGLSLQLDAFAASLAEHLDREREVLLEGYGVPTLRDKLRGRPVLIAVPSADLELELKAVRGYCRDRSPVVIAVDDAAPTVRKAGLSPDVLVGDLQGTDESVLRAAKQRVLSSHAPGYTHAANIHGELGLDFATFDTSLDTADQAILIAVEAGAPVIVTAGIGMELEDVLDRGQATMAANMLTRLRSQDRVVSARAVGSLSKREIPVLWLLALLLAAGAALGAAWLTTEAGRAWLATFDFFGASSLVPGTFPLEA
ncbi:putative cytokinetic ring protein SteA [Buchananella felis]|uniref:putative cytokinetic ring protein SteA n=1 Tax=Buchananella felis TaxID=3231492 RepID=UPI00352983E6